MFEEGLGSCRVSDGGGNVKGKKEVEHILLKHFGLLVEGHPRALLGKTS